MKRTVKKFIAIISAVALVASSVTVYNTKTTMAATIDWSTTAGVKETLQLGDWALYSGGSWAWDHMYGTYDTEATNYGGLTINIDEASSSEWGIQLYTEPPISVTAGQPYKVTLDITSNADFSFDHVKDDTSGIDLAMTTVTTGENEITATYTPTANSVKFLIAMDFIPAGTTITINSLTYTPVTEEELGDQSGNIVDGMSWQGWFEMEGWANYVISNDATTYTLEDKNIGPEWYAIQTGIDGVEFRSGVDYVCAFTLTTSAPKSFTVDNRSNDAEIFAPRQVSASDAGWVDNGNGTYSYNYVGTYSSASTSYLNVRISLGYHDTDTYFAANDTMTATVSDFIIESAEEYGEIETTEPGAGESTTADTTTETSAPAEVTTAGEGDYDWTAVEASNGAYDYYVLEGSATIINLQAPAFGNGNTGIYITVPAGITDIYVNGVEHYDDNVYDEVQGAGCLINEQALTEYINTVVIEYAGGSATVLIRNNNVSSGEETTPGESTTADTTTETSAPAVEAPAAPQGLVYAGNDDLPIYFAWAAEECDYFNVYVNGEYVTSVYEDIFNGTGYESYFPAGVEVVFGVTAVANDLESEMTTITWTNPYGTPEETSDDTTAPEVTTDETEAPTSGELNPYDYEWNVIEGLADGSCSDQYYAAIVEGDVYVAGIQNYQDHVCFYIGVDNPSYGAVVQILIDGVDDTGSGSGDGVHDEIEGAGVFINLDSLPEGEMVTIEIHYATGAVATVLVYNAGEPETEETTPEETTPEETTPEETAPTYDVVIDGGVVATLDEGAEYVLPTDSEYGYYGDGVLYHGGESFTLDGDLAFTTVAISVSTSQGASIYLGDQSGIRFKTEISANVEDLYDSMTEGTLITAADVYSEGGDLTLDSDYDIINVVNSGWYNNAVGTYCGSIVGVSESNYNRNFVARGYVVLTYTDGETETIYANMSAERSIAYVANAIITNGTLGNYTVSQQAKIVEYASYYEA